MFFFFLIRLPPRFTLFPYTTLFRSFRVPSADQKIKLGRLAARSRSGRQGLWKPARQFVDQCPEASSRKLFDCETIWQPEASELQTAGPRMLCSRLAGGGLSVGWRYRYFSGLECSLCHLQMEFSHL